MPSHSVAKYIKETEHAARHLFAGVDECRGPLRLSMQLSRRNTVEEVNRCLDASQAYAGRFFSEATLCGSILQLAFMGLYLFPKNDTIPEDCKTLVKPLTNESPKNKAIQFCVGRRVHNIPIGLLIYAGRNQFNHWDDKSFNFSTTQVFDALRRTHNNNPFFDMAYELNFTSRVVKANHIVLNELRWNSYEAYEADMRAMLGEELPL